LDLHSSILACLLHLNESWAVRNPSAQYSAWFCPFAHRATLALEHHAVNYEWEEALGWEQRPPSGTENFTASDRTDWWYHWKSPGLLAANPEGMVPTLLDPVSRRAVSESIVCVEFIDEYAASRGSAAPSLLPEDPFDRARARIAADKVNRTVTSGYYAALVRTDADERRAGFEQILNGLRRFTSESAGDFWGGSSLGLVDCVLLPYAYRLYVLEHYRGADFRVPTDGEDGLWQRYQGWLERATSLASVAKTLPDKDRYIKHVAKYAEAKARSKVGNAVRRGVDAHNYDDDLDGDAAHNDK
jgi:glutathione S-transferase